MSESSQRQQFFIHAGLPKTGTSFLQDILFSSRDALRDQGLELIPKGRHGHFNLALKVRGMLRPFDDPNTHGVLERFGAQAEQNRAPRALLTQEALAAAPVAAVATLLAPLERYEVHLIVTVRDLGRQVPSAWQQGIKGRKKIAYGEFLEAVAQRTEPAMDFWRNQDLRDVLNRWSTGIAAERIHVITCPQSDAPPGLLLERFCSVLGLDPVTLNAVARTTNPSLGHAQAELLRRVNVALGDRLPHSRDGYRRVARSFLSDRVLQPQSGRRAQLPSAMSNWVEDLTSSWVQYLCAGGFAIVGDLAELHTQDSAYSAELSRSSESELLEVAVNALADILEIRDRELGARERAQTQGAEAQGAELGTRRDRWSVTRIARAALRRR